MTTHRKWIGILCLAVAATALWAWQPWAPRAEPSGPVSTYLDQAPLAANGVPSYRGQIRPILNQRCVVCHGCYDAPCQLKLTNWPGIARGLSKEPVYDGSRLKEAPTTRLGIDATRASQWRELGFSAVLDEQPPAAGHTLGGSVLWQTLLLKEANPLPPGPVLSDRDFDFSISRTNTCPRRDEFDAYARKHPLAGMPYGLPGLGRDELATIKRWLEAGAPDEPVPDLPKGIAEQVATWERFLNGDSLREQLVGRYIYEHLFLGSLLFEGDNEHHRFKLLRSTTAPGQFPVAPIATRRPFDDPGVARPWYRLVRDDETVLAKTHMPYVLSPARMARWRQWFLDGPDQVKALPDYLPDHASNPFLSFQALPLQARYRFLLDDAEYFIMNFIKGPVCRGQIALDVIRDRFWVYFVDPAHGADDDAAEALVRAGDVIKMPAAEGSDAGLLTWRSIARDQDRMLAVKSESMAKRYGGARKITLDFVWRGDGHNPNAALTVFRHFDSATVVKGLVGEPPLTAWVIGYPLLERIYYLLAAGFDVYGNVGHQLQTRLYMDFLRMEGEANFLMLLPEAARIPLRDRWYDGASDEVRQRVLGGAYRFDAQTGVPYPPGVNPQQHLYRLLHQRLAPILDRRYELDAPATSDKVPSAERQGLQRVAAVKGVSVQWLPEAVLLQVLPTGGGAPRTYSLLRNTSHRNVSSLLREKEELRPAGDTVTVVPGFLGAYPNALWRGPPPGLPPPAAGEGRPRAGQGHPGPSPPRARRAPPRPPP
ncbi:MAG TPA: fatty acid cis/trans isomerase [Burkholderiaceae bacterium]|nr:fatty acid cis/trans isomerase [Burkholderiaceae bacterium]